MMMTISYLVKYS